MSTKHIEALKLALEGAANYIDALGGDSRKYRQSLAEQPAPVAKPRKQEPVAWISEVRCVGPEYGKKRYGALPVQSLQPGYYAHTPLYTSSPASKPLTDGEIESINVRLAGNRDLARLFARAIEAAHGITKGNT